MSVCITPEHNNNNDSSPAPPRPPIPGREAVIPWSDEYPPESPSKDSIQTPSYLKWADDMHYLLQDSEGVALFKRFLEQQSRGNSLDFWFACQGFKHNIDPNDSAKIYQLIKVIARTYIRGDSAVTAIDSSTKKTILERITQKVGLDQNIFDEAQQEVEELLRASCYPVFLKSDLYVQYVTTNGFLQPSSSVSSQLECGNDVDQSSSEAQHSKSTCKLSSNVSSSAGAAPLTTENLMVSRRYRSELSCGARLESKSFDEPPPNPYHISYAPVSAQDSELQSHSSEAHTDDAKSHTDSSLENGPGSAKKVWKTSRRNNGRKTSCQGFGRDTSLPHNLLLTRIERDYRGGHCVAGSSEPQYHHHASLLNHASKDRNLAESDPVSFARQLTESLLKLQNQSKSHRTNRYVGETTCDELVDPSGIASAPAGPVDPAETSDLGSGEENSGIFLAEEPWAGRFLAAVRAGRGNLQQDAQSILEEHCSRIWENSAEETPAGKGTRSPGNLTQPHSKALRSTGGSTVPAPVGSTASFDSGVTPDFYTEHRHVHHYHYYHNPAPPASSVSGSSQSQLLAGKQPVGHTAIGGRSVSKTPRSKASDTGDSGVSMLYDKLDPNNDKVLNWILENEKSDLSASSSQKTPLQSWVAQQALLTAPADQPRQPLCMPPLNPPDPTTQLEEAKRRLLLTAANNGSAPTNPATKLAKSTSFPSQTDRSCGQAAVLTTSRKQSDAARTQSNTSTLSGPSEKPLSNAMSQSTSDPFGYAACDACLVVGYYLCGDPVPYRSQWPVKEITLGQFKQLIAKKGNYRYFFKKACDEFDTGVVHEELIADDEILPLWEGKVVAKVEKID